MQYSHEATAKRVPGHQLVLVPGSLPGKLVSTPVLENVKVAAAAGGVGGDDDYDCNEDDDNDDNNEDGNDEGKQTPSGGASNWCPELNVDATTGGWQV